MNSDVDDDFVLRDFYTSKLRKLKLPIVTEFIGIVNDILHVKFKSNL